MDTISQITQAIVGGDKPLDFFVNQSLQAIAEKNPELNCFMSLDDKGEAAIAAQLSELKKKLALGQNLPLAGVPIGVKDNICTRDFETTAASKVLRGFRPPFDAFVVEKLKAAGAIVVGKLNLDEFAMGGSNETSAFGVCRNPHDPTRVPGGSSGGAAAAVAAGMVRVAVGSDTGGSVRQPASFCGVVGFKPTYGALSRRGLIAYGSSLDQVGPMAATVAEARQLFRVMRAHDPLDATSLSDKALGDGEEKSLARLKIGVISEIDEIEMEAQVRRGFQKSLDALSSLGVQVGKASIPSLRYAIPAYYILAMAEASANLARYDGIGFGARSAGGSLMELFMNTRAEFGFEVKKRIMIGSYVLSAGYYDAYYDKASHIRGSLAEEFARAFQDFDALICPTTPNVAYEVGSKVDDSVSMYKDDIFTVPSNLCQLPSISVPCGQGEGLPIGLQFMGPRCGDYDLLRIAGAFEQHALS